jgi:hypothetical protein
MQNMRFELDAASIQFDASPHKELWLCIDIALVADLDRI